MIHRFQATVGSGKVSGLLLEPAEVEGLFVFAHGAGAGMDHRFMEAVANRLADQCIATFRYQFPYMEKGTRRPDHRPVLLETVRSAVAAAADIVSGVPLFAGGKSMGGRMTSMAAAAAPLEGVRGIVFFGFPLHPVGKAGVERADHLGHVTVPMLFLQGARDRLAPLDLLSPVCEGLGSGATLHVVEEADHGFRVLKRSGRTDEEVLDELVDSTRAWIDVVMKSET